MTAPAAEQQGNGFGTPDIVIVAVVAVAALISLAQLLLASGILRPINPLLPIAERDARTIIMNSRFYHITTQNVMIQDDLQPGRLSTLYEGAGANIARRNIGDRSTEQRRTEPEGLGEVIMGREEWLEGIVTEDIEGQVMQK
ncbi:unnamed protein product [Tuber aestivum]|uniref:Uncharacterized protein n=1 Tax=Tuber aestivum TaxID=59557 RepID=A0A292PZA5_9PEZI|nr:unnamed protein product [Tuber aestivum]